MTWTLGALLVVAVMAWLMERGSRRWFETLFSVERKNGQYGWRAFEEAVEAGKRAVARYKVRDADASSYAEALRLARIDLKKLKAQNLALAERVAEQKAEADRRLGYLFPRGLETPQKAEDPLSPTWCRQSNSGVPEFEREGGYQPPLLATAEFPAAVEAEPSAFCPACRACVAEVVSPNLHLGKDGYLYWNCPECGVLLQEDRNVHWRVAPAETLPSAEDPPTFSQVVDDYQRARAMSVKLGVMTADGKPVLAPEPNSGGSGIWKSEPEVEDRVAACERAGDVDGWIKGMRRLTVCRGGIGQPKQFYEIRVSQEFLDRLRQYQESRFDCLGDDLQPGLKFRGVPVLAKEADGKFRGPGISEGS